MTQTPDDTRADASTSTDASTADTSDSTPSAQEASAQGSEGHTAPPQATDARLKASSEGQPTVSNKDGSEDGDDDGTAPAQEEELAAANDGADDGADDTASAQEEEELVAAEDSSDDAASAQEEGLDVVEDGGDETVPAQKKGGVAAPVDPMTVDADRAVVAALPFSKLAWSDPTQTQVWRDRGLVLAVAVVVLLPFLGSFGLWDPWETHYGEVGRQITERNDWISTWWGSHWKNAEGAQEGTYFFSKPIFLMWMMAGGLELFGFSEW
ncbi:MAG: hypothetical protein AAFX99_29325, partial [Myxococcota bacterium]